MSEPVSAKLYTVSEPLDRPVEELTQGETAVDVQFNPTTLKVSLANSLKDNERDDSTRAAQFIEKSSSNLTVELIFDTSDSYLVPNPENSSESVDLKDTDVRLLVKKIAANFMHSTDVGNDQVEPQRCLFAWGAFAFVGIMESLEETLDFFSPEGIPLRATVALKLTESRFQFRNEDAEAAARDTPSLSSAPETVAAANTEKGRKEEDWRDTAMFNGIESVRLSASASLSVPSLSASASLKAQASASVGAGIVGGFGAGLGAGFSAGIGGGLSLGAGASIGGGISAGIGGGISGGVSGGIGAGLGGGISGGVGLSGGASAGVGLSSNLSAGVTSNLSGGLSSSLNVTPPAFSFGASSSLGTSIPGAFSADFKTGGGLSAGSIVAGGVSLHSSSTGSMISSGSVISSSSVSSSGSLNAGVNAQASASIGFD